MKTNEKGAVDAMLVAALLVVLVVGGFVVYRISSTGDDSPVASSQGEEADELAEALPDDLSGIQSLETVQEDAAGLNVGVEIVGVELEVEDGVLVYVFHFADGTTVAYDANTGQQVTLDDDNDDEFEAENEALPAGFVADVSVSEAIRIAKEQRPNSTVEKVELEVEDGEVVYSVRFTDESRVDVSATDGTVERVKSEDGGGSGDSGSDDDESHDDSDDHSHDEDDDSHDDDDDSNDDSEDDEEESDNSGRGSNN